MTYVHFTPLKIRGEGEGRRMREDVLDDVNNGNYLIWFIVNIS